MLTGRRYGGRPVTSRPAISIVPCVGRSNPAIIAGGLLTFTFSFDDVVTSYFLGGNAATPLPLVLFGMIRFRITPEINAIGVMVMLFTVTLMGVAVAVFALMGSAGRGRRAALAEFYGR